MAAGSCEPPQAKGLEREGSARVHLRTLENLIPALRVPSCSPILLPVSTCAPLPSAPRVLSDVVPRLPGGLLFLGWQLRF